jgi:hypothetical protein
MCRANVRPLKMSADDVTRHVGPDGGPIRHSIEIRVVDPPEIED